MLPRIDYYNAILKQHFGERVQKISIHAGFTCPNRDGTKGVGGCTYCNNQTFYPGYCSPAKSVTQQIEEGILFLNTNIKVKNTLLIFSDMLLYI